MRIINDINKKLETAYADLKNAYKGTMESLRLAVDAKDSYTKNHSDRVAYYSVLIAKGLNYSIEEIELIRNGGLFHDIGKIGIPDAILQKAGKLTDEEYHDIKNHPSIGEHILKPAKIFNDIIPMVKHHHERFDGRGYPSGLAGENIPLFARIVCIADAFDAMTSDRSYRPRYTLFKALEELERCKGTQFDPNLVDVFVKEFHENKDKIIRDLEITFIERKDD
jgi:putative nucleotidyltransferase with HDIG domain